MFFGKTSRKSEEERGRRSESALVQLFRPALDASHDAFIIVENRQRIIFANHIMKKIYMIAPGEMLEDMQSMPLFETAVTKGWITIGELIEFHDRKHSQYPTILVKAKIKGERTVEDVNIQVRSVKMKNSTDLYHIINIQNPFAEKVSREKELVNSYTGLPNQEKAFMDLVSMTHISSKNNRFALLIVEIDDFSKIRSIIGFQEMNDIISMMANRLRDLRSENGSKYSVYHLLHEDFMIIIKDLKKSEELYEVADHFRSMLNASLGSRATEHNITFSMGAGKFPENGTLYTLLNSTYGALYKAQENGGNQLVVSSSRLAKEAHREIEIMADIKKSLAEKHFKLFFQPIFDAKDKTVAGAEVLLRWQHPEKGLIMPGLFIPIAEKSDLIMDIGRYVLRESIIQLHNWKKFGFMPIQLSINLSLRELEDEEFIPNLAKLIKEYDFKPFRIKMEITEHASMVNPEMTQEKLTAMKKLGLDISLDDFGTGYSSFSYLADFPIDTLKIDRSFVTDIDTNDRNNHIVSTIIKLAHTFGMNVIAEGIEREEEAGILREHGADYFQGYLFSKPISLMEFQSMLNQEKKREDTARCEEDDDMCVEDDDDDLIVF
jgi:diguanylate cyclase (GGDEF)-like protein